MRIILFFLIFISIAIIITKVIKMDIPLETGIIGTMYTFFYGLFVNSMFKLLDDKYINFRICIGDLIGRVQSVYNVALLTKNKKLISTIRKELSEFVKSYNTLKPDRYFENQEYINRLYESLNDFTVKTPKDAQDYSRLIQFIDGLSITREKIEIFCKKNIKGETRFILIATSLLYLLLIAIISFSNSSVYMIIIGILLALMVLFVLLLMMEMDNLSYGTKYIKDKNIDEIVVMIRGPEEINPEKNILKSI